MKPLCLLDMDGTLADFDTAMYRDLLNMAAPEETEYIQSPDTFSDVDAYDPPYIKARKRVIKKQPNWWLEIPKYKPGWDIYEVAKKIGYDFNVLTKGPHYSGDIWRQKFEWCRIHLGHETPVTIAENKTPVCADVLVDDWPPYVDPWLEKWKDGIVIMPAQRWNIGYNHPRVIRYDGTNLADVHNALASQFLMIG